MTNTCYKKYLYLLHFRCDLEDKGPSSSEDSISHDVKDSILSQGLRPSGTDRVLDFKTESDIAVQMSEAFPDQLTTHGSI
jgi:hypothetical protein